jgi:hypothetical protein
MDPSESRDAPPRTTSGAAFAAWDPSRRDAVMRWSLIVLWLFNLEDYVLTQAALRAGAIESNPVIAYFLERGPGPALAFKLGIVTVGCLLLWRLRRYPAAVMASLGLALAYVLVTVFHLALSLS